MTPCEASVRERPGGSELQFAQPAQQSDGAGRRPGHAARDRRDPSGPASGGHPGSGQPRLSKRLEQQHCRAPSGEGSLCGAGKDQLARAEKSANLSAETVSPYREVSKEFPYGPSAGRAQQPRPPKIPANTGDRLKPSVGLEPTTPSLPSTPEGLTADHDRRSEAVNDPQMRLFEPGPRGPA
jgi:hypothetical protein